MIGGPASDILVSNWRFAATLRWRRMLRIRLLATSVHSSFVTPGPLVYK